MEDKEVFNYTYSAKEQDEIKAIRKKYAVGEETEDRITRLRRLDRGVIKKANTVSIAFGTIGTLILGMGMSLAISDFGKVLGSYSFLSMPLGIVIGLAGIALVCAAYPIYERTVKKERKKIAPEILRLTDELMK